MQAVSQDALRLQQDAAYLWQKRTPETLQQAEVLLRQVTNMAPRYASAQSDLAIVYDLMVEYGVLTPEQGYQQARQAAETALRLDPGNAQAQTVLGDVSFFWDKDYPAGLAHFEAALRQDGQLGLARHWYASALMSMGRFNEAAVQIEEARQIEPASRSIQVSSAMIALGAQHPEEARRILMQLIANEPDYRSPYRFLAFTELALGNEQGYLAAWRERFRLTGDAAGPAVVEAGSRAYAFGASYPQAMLDAAQTTQAELEPYFMAHLLALAGRWEDATNQLGRTPTRHAFYYCIDPAFSAARKVPEFLTAIAELGLPAVP
jgi:predicted Zn-dependent protease